MRWGAVADRLDRRVVLKAGIVLSWVTMIVMLGLALFDAIAYWHVAVASGIGIFWTMDMPVRRRIVGDISGSTRLVTAMSLDSATNNATRAIGPLAGGFVYETLGLVGVYALTSIGFVLAFGLTMGIRTRGDILEADGPSSGLRSAVSQFSRDLSAGFRFAIRDQPVRWVLAVTVVFNVWGFPVMSMLPVLGKERLSLDPSEIGFLAASEGLGALAGALFLANRPPPEKRFAVVYYGGVLLYVTIVIVLAGLTSLPLALLGLTVLGFATAAFSSMQSTLIYTIAPPEMRSRIFGLLALCIGSGLFGLANIGLMAEVAGVATALAVVGLQGLAAMGILALIRPKGPIIPPARLP